MINDADLVMWRVTTTQLFETIKLTIQTTFYIVNVINTLLFFFELLYALYLIMTRNEFRKLNEMKITSTSIMQCFRFPRNKYLLGQFSAIFIQKYYSLENLIVTILVIRLLNVEMDCIIFCPLLYPKQDVSTRKTLECICSDIRNKLVEK